VGNIKMDLKDK